MLRFAAPIRRSGWAPIPARACPAALDRIRCDGSELNWKCGCTSTRSIIARAGRGLLTVSALWLWGGGAPMVQTGIAAAIRPARPMTAWADELFIDGLAHCAGLRVGPLPQRWPQQGADLAPAEDLLAVCSLGAAPDERSLRTMDSDWIAPALAAWRGGQLRTLTLLAADRAVTLHHSSLRSMLRKFRRIRPWWEALQ